MAKTFSQTKGAGGSSIGGAITGGTAGSVLFVNPNGIIAQDNANLFYDSTNHSLNIGTLSAVSSTARKVIELNAGGYGDPNAFNVASDGDKIILYRSAAAAYDGSIGVGSLSDMWFKSSGNAAGAGQFKWFTGIGTFVAMVLSGSGDLSIAASFTSTSVNTTTINASTINTNAIISSGSGVFQATLNAVTAGSYAGAYIRSVASSAVGYIGLSDSTAGNFYFHDALCVGTQNAFPFRINTNDTARVTVDATGKVGIGTIAPASQLHVLANYADIRVDTISVGDPTMSFSQVGVLKWSLYNQVSGNILGFYDWTNSSFRFVVQPGTGQALTVLANNNVGIDTTTPGYKLDVSGDIGIGTLGKTLRIATGTNASKGTGTLAGGSVTINTNAVSSISDVFITDTGGGANIGSLYVSAVSANTSFTVSSTNGLDVSTFNWVLIKSY
jgi:filamentous hemagglutinin family protein